MTTPSPPITLRALWRQFLPLSVSDVTMAAGDPLITTTLAHLPGATANLSAIGVAKAIAIFFESPIIMLLHASNALAPSAASRRAVRRFMLMACAALTLALALIVTPWPFELLVRDVMGVTSDLQPFVREGVALLILWPAAIGWRRYYQGLLIRSGNSRALAQAGFARLGAVAVVLMAAAAAGLPGVRVAGLALIIGVLVEALLVTTMASRCGATKEPPRASDPALPATVRGVWRFYWPLANSMLVVWGGRALLVALVARSADAAIALAAWPAAWGLTLVIANGTRMVQQVIIKNRATVPARLLLAFVVSVGAAFTLPLALVGATPLGNLVIGAFVGQEAGLVEGVRPVVMICSIVPLIIALQNAMQGFLIGDGKTGSVNLATWLGTGTLLLVAWVGVRSGIAGATAAATAMIASLAVETALLAARLPRARSRAAALAAIPAGRSHPR